MSYGSLDAAKMPSREASSRTAPWPRCVRRGRGEVGALLHEFPTRSRPGWRREWSAQTAYTRDTALTAEKFLVVILCITW